ncbi:aromatic ring-hydroxylating dioxygenase subunit alpha [Ammoniphilus sp. CFH 90114]|uniref:aromatic ring-hydroxylating oxygenase subunit alpha n=1 Tax=Ammoniphilus sp. CFH 90114 TaxID=2493665 RepID=UPI00100E9ECA|nr:aromatic ring-hydroxylating dioxygenase subunit alpha [Ammoniphilus sp. CFH 90114]RXT06998.1 aromatic ring-hydroxylating dioxygenase subunit alpha [Ammoniphilus sp. CFH 90114]
MAGRHNVRNGIDKELLAEIKQKLEQGLFPQWMVTDPDIYDLEVDKIFGRTWQYLGHESELKEAGDYVTRWLMDDPVLLVKNKKGEINVFLNSCSHRGTHLCTADVGNRKTFTCPFHGWSFNTDGELIGVVAGDKVFGERLNKQDWNLHKIPRVDTYRGMIFGNLDPNAMPLEDYLGDLKWYIDLFLARSDGGMEVIGAPQRWVVNTNWKMSTENFGGDPYHVATTHKSTVELGISPKDPFYASYGHQVKLNHGHCVNVSTTGPGFSVPSYQGLPEEMWPMFERNLSKEQLEVYKQTVVIVGTCFPNLSFHCPVHGNEGHLHNYLTLRIWRPIGPDKIEIWAWFLIDKAAPEEYKMQSYKGYVASFGPSGTLEADDTEIWTRVAKASKGKMARNREMKYNNVLNYMMGMDKIEPDESWPGPGIAYPTCFVDYALRGMHEYWLELLTKEYEDEQ